MRFTEHRITIVKINRPKDNSLNEELQYFGDSFGLFGLRDKNNSCFRIFIELLKATRNNTALSSDHLAITLELTRGTVVHHLNKLIEAGIAISMRNRYMLRAGNLKAIVEEIQKDANRTFNDLKQIADDIDNKL